MCNDNHFNTYTMLYFSESGGNSQGTHQMESLWGHCSKPGCTEDKKCPH